MFFDKLLSRASVLLLESIIRLFVVAVVSFWMARILGPEKFGILNFASVLLAILVVFVSLGLDTPVIYLISNQSEDLRILEDYLSLRCVVALVVYFVSLLVLFFFRDDFSRYLSVSVVAISSLLLNPYGIFEYWFKARSKTGYLAFARISSTLVASVGKIILLLLGYSLEMISWIFVLEAIVLSVGYLFFYLKAGGGNFKFSFRKKLNKYKNIFFEYWPYMVSALLVILYMKIDVLMLGIQADERSLGLYSLAQKLSEIVYVVPVVIIDVIYPILVNGKSSINVKQRGQLFFDLALASAFVAIFFSYVLVPPMIDLVFGEKYHDASVYFSWHVLSALPIAMNTARYKWVMVSGGRSALPLATLVGLLINVAMNYYMIPSMGAWACVIATLVSYFISAFLTSFVFKDFRQAGVMQFKAIWPWFRIYIFFKKEALS